MGKTKIPGPCPYCGTPLPFSGNSARLGSRCPSCQRLIPTNTITALDESTRRLPASPDASPPGTDKPGRRIRTIAGFLAERGFVPAEALSDAAESGADPDSRVSKYDLGPTIAHGGMGRVLEARDVDIRRTVAMKVMLSPEAPDAGVLRFIGEAQITGQLEHPNILPVYELGIDVNGEVFYTMKLVQGRTLSSILDHIAEGDDDTIGAYPLQHLLGVFMKVCDAVAFAHSRGIVHRDLKPDNIMVGEFGEVYLMDWGLARPAATAASPAASSRADPISSVRDDVGEAVEFTLAGSIVGTPKFMAPEQAMGRSRQPDSRTDIYALGAVLYTILTLRAPVQGTTVREVLTNIRGHRITPPADIVACPNPSASVGTDDSPAKVLRSMPHCPGGHVPPALSAVTMKCLEYAPADRYATVKELQADVNAYLGGFATRAEAAGLFRQIILLVHRHQGVVAGVAAVFVALTIGLTVSLVQWKQAEQARKVATVARVKAEHAGNAERLARMREENLRRQAEYDAYLGGLARCRRKIEQHAYIPALKVLNECPLEHRGWEWNHLAELARPWDRTAPGHSCVDLADETGLLATGGVAIRVMQLPELRRVAEIDIESIVLAISPDGSRLATASHDSCHLWDLEKRRQVWTSRPEPRGTIRDLAFSPDGATVGVVNLQGAFQWLRVATGEALWTYTPSSASALHALAISPSGKQVLLQGQTTTMHGVVARLIDLSSRTVVREYHSPSGSKVGFAAAFSPDGGTFAWTTLATVFLTRCDDGETIVLEHQDWTEATAVRSLAFAPDSRSIFVGVSEPCIYQYSVSDGGLVRIYRGHPGTVRRLCLPADGTHVWSASETHVLSHRIPPSPHGVLEAVVPETLMMEVAITNDARIVARSYQVRVWDPWNATIRQFDGMPMPRAMALHRPSRRIALADGAGNIEIRALEDEALLTTWTAPGGRVWSIAWFHDGQQVVTLSADKALRIWDLETCDAVRKIPVNTAWEAIGVRVHPDGQTLYTNGMHYSRISRIDLTGEQQTVGSDRLVVPRLFLCEFTPDGNALVTASQMTVLLLDARTLERIQEYHGHSGQVHAATISPDGKRIVSAGTDGVLRIWDRCTGRELLDLPAHQATVTGLAFGREGRLLASCDADGTVRLSLSGSVPRPVASAPPTAAVTLKASALSFDFESCDPGSVPNGWKVYGASGSAGIAAAADQGVGATSGLVLTDGPEPAKNYQPFVSCYLDSPLEDGTWRWSFDIKLSATGTFTACCTGEGSYPHSVGPHVSMSSGSGLSVRGVREPMLTRLPAGEWLHVVITCPLGSPHETWMLNVTQKSTTLLDRDCLPITGSTFALLRCFQFFCYDTCRARAQIDNVTLQPAP